MTTAGWAGGNLDQTDSASVGQAPVMSASTCSHHTVQAGPVEKAPCSAPGDNSGLCDSPEVNKRPRERRERCPERSHTHTCTRRSPTAWLSLLYIR